MRRRSCFYCRKHLTGVDYLDVKLLQRHLGTWGKLKSGRETGTCSRHQRRASESLKRARFLAVIPYTNR